MLARTFGCVHVVRNRTLAARRERHASDGKPTSCAESNRALTARSAPARGVLSRFRPMSPGACTYVRYRIVDTCEMRKLNPWTVFNLYDDLPQGHPVKDDRICIGEISAQLDGVAVEAGLDGS
jgi:hypothetical protein